MPKLMNCPDCGGIVSKQAKACPGCGRPISGGLSGFLRKPLGIAFMAIVILWVMGVISMLIQGARDKGKPGLPVQAAAPVVSKSSDPAPVARVAPDLKPAEVLGLLDPDPSAPDKPKAEPLVPDPNWKPRAGDVATLYSKDGDGIYVVSDIRLYDTFLNSWRAHDEVGLRNLMEKKSLGVADSMTDILVIDVIDNQFLTGNHPAIEGRLRGGEYKDQKVYVPQELVAKLVHPSSIVTPIPPQVIPPQPEQVKEVADFGVPLPQEEPEDRPKRRAPEPKKKKSKPLAETSTIREASNAFRAARLIDTQGEAAKAVEAYRKFLKDYPNAEAVGYVKTRLKALTGMDQ